MGDIDKYKILFESIKNKFDFLSNADNALDSKVGTLIGFEIAIGIGYLSFAFNGLTNVKYIESILGMIILSISLIFLLIVNWPKDYITISVNLLEHQDYLDKPEKELLLQLISDAQEAFTINNKILKLKVKLYRLAIIFLIISVILLILSKLGKFYV